MKRVLLAGDEHIHEIVDSVDDQFEVHSAMQWVDAPDDITDRHTWTITDGVVVFIDPTPMETNYILARGIGFGSIGDQLDSIYHHLAGGGTLDTNSPWYQHITAIKTEFPKDDQAAINAAQDIINAANQAALEAELEAEDT
jgi:hypothetical protein